MKFFEIDEEYLKKGGLITRDKKSGLAFGIVNGRLVAFKNGVKIEPEEIFKGYVADLLASDWEYVTYKGEIWKPESGDTIYYVSSTGHVYEDTFCACSNCDNDKVSFNNVFKTREDAKKMLEKLKIINRLRELSNVKFVDDCSKLRYSVSYVIDAKKVCPSINRYSRILPFEIYFETATDCQKAIDIIGEENLKKYYFDVVD